MAQVGEYPACAIFRGNKMNLVRVKEEPKAKRVLKFDRATGAVVDGVTVIPGGIKFAVRAVMD